MNGTTRVPDVAAPPRDGASGTGEWPRRSFLELGALPGAVPCARLHARQVMWEWGLDALRDDTELVVSEPPVRLNAGQNADGGRGLLLVEALSDRWDWYAPAQPDGGKIVWATL